MKLLLLHGSPAVGKLTVSKAINQIIPSKLFDNHAAIDIALTIFDFGEAGFWELVQSVRVMVLKSAAEQNVPLLIMTYCYSHPEDEVDFLEFDNVIRKNGGEILPVYLSCSEAEAIRRVGGQDRIKRKKISTELGLKNFNAKHNIVSVSSENCLMIDTENQQAEQTANDIISHFNLA